MQNNPDIKGEEAELVRGCLEKRERDYEKLYNRYYGKMMAVCTRYARDRDEAKDILQEGFIRVFQSIQQFNFQGSLEGWVRRVMVTTAINYYRKNNLRSITDYLGDDFEKAELENVSVNVDTVLEHFSAKYIMELIQELPPAYKLVFNMHALEGYSHAEIAALMGITESTSRSNLTKARLKLQTRLTLLNIQEKERTQYAG